MPTDNTPVDKRKNTDLADEQSNLTTLPYELILKIFSLVDRNALLALLSTCRDTNRVANDNVLWFTFFTPMHRPPYRPDIDYKPLTKKTWLDLLNKLQNVAITLKTFSLNFSDKADHSEHKGFCGFFHDLAFSNEAAAVNRQVSALIGACIFYSFHIQHSALKNNKLSPHILSICEQTLCSVNCSSLSTKDEIFYLQSFMDCVTELKNPKGNPNLGLIKNCIEVRESQLEEQDLMQKNDDIVRFANKTN